MTSLLETVEGILAKLRVPELVEVSKVNVAIRAVAEKALDEAASESIPIEIVVRVERLVAHALAAPVAERDAALRELDTLSERVISTWLTDYDPARFTQALELARNNEVLRLSPPARLDSKLGWEPIDTTELQARVQHAMASDEAVRTRLRYRAEQHDIQPATALLERARSEQGLGQRGKVAKLEQALRKEHDDLVREAEALTWNAYTALSTFPPLGVYSALTAAAGALQTRLESVPSLAPRAVFLAALVELRRAVEHAFPGLRQAISGDDRNADRTVSGAAYRTRIVPRDTEQANTEQTDEGDLRAAIDAAAIRPLLGRALGHAVLLGDIARQLARREAASSDTALERDRLGSRRTWHMEAVRWVMQEVLARIHDTTQKLPQYRLRNLVAELHTELEALEPPGGTYQWVRELPIENRGKVLQTIERIDRLLEEEWGCDFDREALLREVFDLLQKGKAPDRGTSAELVNAVAKNLRGTEFVIVEERSRHTYAKYTSVANELEATNPVPSTWSLLNLLTDTPAERARRESHSALADLSAELQEDHRQLARLMDSALDFHPPARLYYGLDTVRAWVNQIRCEMVRDEPGYHCVLRHKEAALDSVRDWTSRAGAVFGAMQSDAEIIEWFVASDLA